MSTNVLVMTKCIQHKIDTLTKIIILAAKLIFKGFSSEY